MTILDIINLTEWFMAVKIFTDSCRFYASTYDGAPVNFIDSFSNVNLYRKSNELNFIDERTYQITGFH